MVIVVMTMVVAFAPVNVFRLRNRVAVHSGLVIGHRLHHAVLRLGRLHHVCGLWRVIGARYVTTGCIAPCIASLVGDARADQATGTGANNRAIATTHGFTNHSTRHGANASTQNRLKLIGVDGLRSQSSQAANQ